MEWIPSEEEYNPGIAKEQWIELVQDKNIFNENALITFACIQKAKVSTCADMSEEFGRNVNFYNSNVWRTGERIYKKINCPLSEREEGGNRFWSVCCLGRDLKNGRFKFKIRPELQEAFDVTGVLEGIEVMGGKNISCIMANIAWNENNWKSPSDNKTNFRWTQVEGNIPNESWNFDFDNPRNSENEILGFTQFKNPPKNAEKDKFLIIFRSDNKIIGFYGNAEIKKDPLMIKEDEYVNLLGDKELSILLENKLDDLNHNFLFGKDRISQGGFNYLNPINAQTILDEAIKINPNQIDTLEKIKEWLNQGDSQMEEQYWLIAPGENARKWAEYSKNGEIGIGWEELGNIEKYGSDYESFQNDYIKTYKSENDNYRGSSPKQIWDFYKSIAIGDIIFARNGVLQIVGMGKVKSDYIYDDSRDEYKQIRKVEWEKIGEWNYPGQSSRDTVHRLKPEQAKEIIKIMSMKDEPLVKKYANLLNNTKNLILTGAPGTGKTFMAKQIAKELGCKDDNIGFVQFHPSYDYTDFVEGLRPTDKDGNGNVGFERRDGVFKKFCEKALKNLVDSNKTIIQIQKELSWQEKLMIFIDESIDDRRFYALSKNGKIGIENYHEDIIYIQLPDNPVHKSDQIHISKLLKILNSEEEFDRAIDVERYLNGYHSAEYSYLLAIYKAIRDFNFSSFELSSKEIIKQEKKNFVFIIDEINRGEVAKIFGELFYSVDPGYRVSSGDLDAIKNGNKTVTTIKTQYANLETEGNEFDKALGTSDFGHFFIPENVYIIGTMNDIDRSVESMDFAFRRRFTWAEVKAEDTQYMLDAELDSVLADEAKRRMENLNNAISKIDGLNEAYHIGASYFLKLKNYDGDFGKLWEYHIKGILQEYLRGSGNEAKIAELKAAYDKTEEN